MISNQNVTDVTKKFLQNLKSGKFDENLEEAFQQLDQVIADYPKAYNLILNEYLPELNRGTMADRQHMLLIADCTLKYICRNLAKIISEAFLILSAHSHDSELINVLIEFIIFYRFENLISLEHDGRSIRFESKDHSFVLSPDGIRISHRLSLICLLLFKYSCRLIIDEAPKPQEIQSIIQRLNETISILKNFDTIELKRYPTLFLFYGNEDIKFSKKRASQLFEPDIDILKYDEKLYDNFSVPLFPLILEDKLSFEGKKIKILNEGLGCLPPFVICIRVGETEFEFGESSQNVAPNDDRDLYVSEPSALKQFLDQQKPNIDIKIVLSFKKFGCSYEYHLLSEPVGAWVDK